ncbi:hypothetical protein C5167_006880 [Papaver somniferum]|uniref:RecA family profile 2 domain-containing protein n=2 Tax=Papaver somniferum TaxID=3469 RepID=A0A4Y7JHM1_PAPSO|nr:hypothetical protein C5167_006880 [Papaver somniferum]
MFLWPSLSVSGNQKYRQEALMLENEVVFDKAIRDVQSDIGKIHDLCRDLAVLIHDQDTAASHVESTAAQIQVVKVPKRASPSSWVILVGADNLGIGAGHCSPLACIIEVHRHIWLARFGRECNFRGTTVDLLRFYFLRSNRLRSTKQRIGQLVKETFANLKARTDPGAHSDGINPNTKTEDAKLAMDFQATLQNYQKIQGLAIIGREANEQLRLGVVDPQSSSTFLEEQTRCSQETLMLENEIIFNEATIEERDECIRDIHSDIVEIHDIYRDLAVLIREQAVGGERLDAHLENLFSCIVSLCAHCILILWMVLADNIDSIAAAVKSTSKLQLVKAHKSVKCWSSRKMARFVRNISLARRYLVAEEYRHGVVRSSFQVCNFSSKATVKKKSPKSDGSESGEDSSPKKIALQQALDQIEASFGKGSIMWLGRQAAHKFVPVVSTGSFSLDMALGTGGLPKGRVVEIYGPEASGKTTLALHVIAESQKTGGACAFIDAEHSLDPTLAESLGVQTKDLLFCQPDSGEQALSEVDTLIRSGAVNVIVVDSVAALVPKGELDGEMGDAHMAMQARLMSQALRKLSHSLAVSQTVLIFINQIRSKLATFGSYGPQETTCGGNALKFYASVRLNIKRIGSVKKGETVTGNVVQVKVVKNKHAPPFKVAQFDLMFGKGISRAGEVVDLAVKHKFIKKAASMFYFDDEKSFRGRDAVIKYLEKTPVVLDELIVKLREKLMLTEMEEGGSSDTETSDEEVVAPEEEQPAVVEA